MARASVLLVLLAGTPLLLGCTAALDQAHSVQTRLGRIDEIVHATVATPSASTAARITVTYADAGTARELGHLLAAIDDVAGDEHYPPYVLELQPADATEDRLTVDDEFVGSHEEDGVLANWVAVTSALLGDVAYRYQPGNEEIGVSSGAAISHDVGEASRIGYGFPETTWTFEDDDILFSAAGRVSPTDVTLFQAVQRTVSSDVLPAPASSWRLERLADHVQLDLDVRFPGSPVPPERVTIARHGDEVARLVTGTLAALRLEGAPIWLRLHNRSATGDDVFGYWVSDGHPVRGRDRLARGWDQWLAHLARQVG